MGSRLRSYEEKVPCCKVTKKGKDNLSSSTLVPDLIGAPDILLGSRVFAFLFVREDKRRWIPDY